MKATPDELKRFAQICTKGICSEQCPYYERENCVETMMTDALAYIEQLESRVEPVQHGYWIIPTPPDVYTYCKILCSVCNRVAGKHQTEYCPRCGAKMDLPRPRSNSDENA